ncbi:NAD(P)-binding protein [Pseudovirgaria hyperparasitica]|uniref:NAD(P)-binding protein n=1 Tax=Pseudovirgaria hyperparasitica TaxID=470096 RepID=A0A6A6W3L1_9PEZI|nr:NAD(P)-binding protein [Pseudovirgaria hyperparasitica]KAF2756604.1 NAD(P)-binding protein [Pseudovirgaria hyperparasitica]
MQWLITGCSTGLGLSLARAVLSRPGEKLIATSRNPQKTPDLVHEITSNPNAVWEALDVSATDLEARLDAIIAKHGPINVLINNAGYAAGGIFEASPISLVRELYETNFFGAMRVMHKLVPHMRENGQVGVIVNVTSNECWEAHAGSSAYTSSKFALQGLSQALAAELAPFNIRVFTAQPGGMRTAFMEPAKVESLATEIPDAYKGTIADFTLQAIKGLHSSARQDPDKTAIAIVHEVLQPSEGPQGKVLRLQLGSEAVASMEKQLELIQAESDLTKRWAIDCDI